MTVDSVRDVQPEDFASCATCVNLLLHREPVQELGCRLAWWVGYRNPDEAARKVCTAYKQREVDEDSFGDDAVYQIEFQSYKRQRRTDFPKESFYSFDAAFAAFNAAVQAEIEGQKFPPSLSEDAQL